MWPELRVADWIATRDTLHLWTQVVGKIRMAFSPMINHWWQVTLYVSPRGLTTGSIPNGDRSFDIEFDFRDHQLRIRTQDGDIRQFPLAGLSVAEFHAKTLSALRELGITVSIQATPNEVDPAIPFAQDTEHAAYDPNAVHLYWKQLVQADRVMNDFRARFGGKVSPVHFFWGAMDLACTRFSGRPAPTHPGGSPNCADWVMVEGYSHEVSSCGFWAGGGEEGAFYAYAYPEPEGFSQYAVSPPGAYDSEARLFLLPYEAVRTADDPDAVVAQFLQSTYEAAAELADWDRSALEVDPERWRSVARYARHG